MIVVPRREWFVHEFVMLSTSDAQGQRFKIVVLVLLLFSFPILAVPEIHPLQIVYTLRHDSIAIRARPNISFKLIRRYLQIDFGDSLLLVANSNQLSAATTVLWLSE